MNRRLLVLLCLVAIPAAPSFSQTFERDLGPAARFYRDDSKFSFKFEPKDQGGDVKIEADRQEIVREDYVLLEGNVRLQYQDVTLSADSVTYNLRTRDVTAAGNVILDQGPAHLTARRIVFNLESRKGTLFEASGSFDPSIYFTGDEIEKLDEDSYRITNGLFTSCDIDQPSWSFRLSSGIINLDDYAYLRDITFRAKKAPLFWAPYIVWPTKTDRSRGFLIPKPGYSSRFGSYLKSAYFIPFGTSADTTVAAEVYSKGYVALGAEARYRPTPLVDGRLETFAVRDAETDEIEWKYLYRHTQEQLPGGFRGVVDIQDYSNINFFQTFERRFELNTLSNIYSSAYLTKNRSNYSLNLRADRREHFLGPDNRRLFEQLPGVDFRTYPNRIGRSPFYFSLESSASRLRTNEADYYRTDLAPTLTMQLRTPPWLSIKPQVSVRQTNYSASLDPTTRQITDDSLSRFYARGEVEIVGPSVSRIYDTKIATFTKFKHVIEPRVRYLYTTDVEEQNRVIRFDTVDSPFLPLVRDLVEYSLTQRIFGKEDGPNAQSRDLMSLSIRQSVALSDPFESTGGYSQFGDGKFSPVTVNAHLNPYQSFSVDATLTVGNESHQVDQASLSAAISREQSYLNLTWFATFLQPGRTTGDSSQLRISTGAPVWRDVIRADAQVYYDARRGSLLEQRYIMGLFASCYTISLEYRDYLQLRGLESSLRNRDYQLSVSLKNVGTFVDFRGSLDDVF